MRRKFLFSRLAGWAWAAYGLEASAALALSALCIVRFHVWAPLWIAAACLAAQAVWYALWIRKPCQETERALHLVIGGYSLDALARLRVPVSAADHLVIEKLAHRVRALELEGVTKKRAEYLALQNQINPHFLYNTLESIRSEALIVGMDELADMTESLAVFFRYCISNVSALVTLEEELSNVENYFRIQRFRFGEKLSLQIEIAPEDEAQALRCRMPKMTLQPIVENAVFHGIEPCVDNGILRICVTLTGASLQVSVSDNGIGMEAGRVKAINERLGRVEDTEEPPEKQRGGIALINVNRRIKLLFGETYGLCVYSMPGCGTDVVITLPNDDGEVSSRAG